MNNRIKLLRQTLDITQSEFASKIGIQRGTLAKHESSNTLPSSPVISNICDEFNVNEEWLRTGNGNMFKTVSNTDEILALFKDVQMDADDSFKKRFITSLSHLNENQWQALADMAQTLLNSRNEDNNDEHKN